MATRAKHTNPTTVELTRDNIVLVRVIGDINRQVVIRVLQETSALCETLRSENLPVLVAVDVSRVKSQDSGARTAAKDFLRIKYDRLVIYGAKGSLRSVMLYLLKTVVRFRRAKYFDNKRPAIRWLRTNRQPVINRGIAIGITVLVLNLALTLFAWYQTEQRLNSTNDPATKTQLEQQIIERQPARILYFGISSSLLITWIVFITAKRRHEALDLASDITNDLQRERNRALIEARRTQAILSSIGDGVFAVDTKGNIILFNNVASGLSGFSQSEAIGKHYKDILKFRRETTGRPHYSFISTALRGRRSSMATHAIIINREGKRIPVADSAAPIIDHSNNIIGAIVVFRDISSEYELEKAKDEFVAIASHQLRTPATAVKQFLGIILDGYAGKISSEQRDMVTSAFENNERQLGIINDLLNVASIDSGRLALRKEQSDINHIVESVIREMHQMIREQGQELEVDMPDPPKSWRVDPKLFRMVIENLLTNASKYTPHNGVLKITVGNDPNTLNISISDTGIGIAEDDLPKLFAKFSRINNPLSAKVGGSGLGLYLAQQIVRMHGGTIHVDSKLQQGSTFTVTIISRGTRK